MGKLQHYVPRFYLKAWLDNNGTIFCLQKAGKLFGTKNLMNLGGENYFYRLQDLTVNDITLIKKIAIDPSPERFKRLHHDLVVRFDLIMRLKAIEHDDPEVSRQIEMESIEYGESINTGIEEGLQAPLAAMRVGDTSFIKDDHLAAGFFYAIAHQYMRTKRTKEALLKRDLRGPLDQQFVMCVWNVLSHICAVNIGWSLFAERRLSTIVLLDNLSAEPFITADQPIINLRGTDEAGGSPPEKMDLFFPLSPTKAMLLLEANSDYQITNHQLSAKEVHAYNLRLAKNAHEQIYSNGHPYLETIKAELARYGR